MISQLANIFCQNATWLFTPLGDANGCCCTEVNSKDYKFTDLLELERTSGNHAIHPPGKAGSPRAADIGMSSGGC